MSTHDLGDGVTLYSRDTWAQGRQVVGDPGSRALSEIDEFIAHHSGGVTLGDPDPFQWARNIYDYHVHTLGYSAEAYEAFIAVHNGKPVILEGRPIGMDSAATYMHNHRGYAACYLRANSDGAQDDVVPLPVKTAFRKLAQVIAFTCGHTMLGTCHADCKPDQTACAGQDINGWVRAGGLWAPFDEHPAPKPVPHPQPNPAPVWPPFSGNNLARGSRGDQVRRWQSRMVQLGAALGVTGQFDRPTEDVTRFFQGQHHLATDGIVGPKTWAAAR